MLRFAGIEALAFATLDWKAFATRNTGIRTRLILRLAPIAAKRLHRFDALLCLVVLLLRGLLVPQKRLIVVFLYNGTLLAYVATMAELPKIVLSDGIALFCGGLKPLDLIVSLIFCLYVEPTRTALACVVHYVQSVDGVAALVRGLGDIVDDLQ